MKRKRFLILRRLLKLLFLFFEIRLTQKEEEEEGAGETEWNWDEGINVWGDGGGAKLRKKGKVYIINYLGHFE